MECTATQTAPLYTNILKRLNYMYT